MGFRSPSFGIVLEKDKNSIEKENISEIIEDNLVKIEDKLEEIEAVVKVKWAKTDDFDESYLENFRLDIEMNI